MHDGMKQFLQQSEKASLAACQRATPDQQFFVRVVRVTQIMLDDVFCEGRKEIQITIDRVIRQVFGRDDIEPIEQIHVVEQRIEPVQDLRCISSRNLGNTVHRMYS